MNKVFRRILAVLLCLSIAIGGSMMFTVSAEAEESKNISATMKEFFDKFVNVTIDVVHRFIMIIRYPWEPNPDVTVDMDKFHLTFVDEFEGDFLNGRIWYTSYQGVRKGGFWDSSMTSVQDGKLVIGCAYKEDGAYGPGYYTNRIDTSLFFQQKYGYFECRAKLPAAEGLWSAFWMSNHNVNSGVPGVLGTEIDIFESPLYYRKNEGKDNSMITSNIHYGGYDLNHRYKNVTVAKANNPYEEFNTYGMEWNKDGYTFYINGQKTGFSRYGGVSKSPEYMILSMEVDGVGGKPFHGWSGIITNNDPEALPAQLEVDYVRAYQYNDPAMTE